MNSSSAANTISLELSGPLPSFLRKCLTSTLVCIATVFLLIVLSSKNSVRGGTRQLIQLETQMSTEVFIPQKTLYLHILHVLICRLLERCVFKDGDINIIIFTASSKTFLSQHSKKNTQNIILKISFTSQIWNPLKKCHMPKPVWLSG